MSRKKFNAYAGKIVNLAEFETTLDALKSEGQYQGFAGFIGAVKDLSLKQKDPGFPISSANDLYSRYNGGSSTSFRKWKAC
jgi:hypothetical protein